MNSVVVPIDHNEIAQLVFDCSEDVPNDFYVNIMDLMKIYYENGNNLPQIHIYLNENENRINKDLFKKIKKLLKQKSKLTCTFKCNCNCPECCTLYECYKCITSLTFTCLFILVIIGMVVAVILSSIKGS